MIKKSVLGIVLLLALLFKVNTVYGVDFVFPGEGTEGNPFEISSASDFTVLADKVNEGDPVYSKAHYRMKNDVDLKSTVLSKPIGFSDYYNFSGVFDGNGFFISNFNMNINKNNSNTEYFGLFGYNKGIIKDVKITGDIYIGGYSGSYAGGISGYNSGSIDNVVSFVNVYGSYAGGIVANNYGDINRSINGGTVKSWMLYAGGITASNSGTIKDSINKSSVSGDNGGGIAGRNGGVIQNSVNQGSIVGITPGGIVSQNNGSSYKKAIVENVLNVGTVAGSVSGGIIGSNGDYGIVKSSYSIGHVTGRTVGAVIGNNLGMIEHLYYSSYFPKGIATGGGLAAKIDNESLEDMSQFSGFDFNETWVMNGGPVNIPVPSTIGPMNFWDALYFEKGTGMIFDPFVIESVSDLVLISHYPTAFFELGNSIDISDGLYAPDGLLYNGGSYWKPIKGFFGVIDGNGFSINNLKLVGDASSDNYGFMETLYGAVKNLNLTNVDFLSISKTGTAGILAAITKYGSIENVTITGKIVDFKVIGGITASLEGNLFSSVNYANISSSGVAGGLINTGRDATIRDVANYGDVIGFGSAGIARDLNYYSLIDVAINRGNITGLSKSINDRSGGITSFLSTGSTITNALNTGKVVNHTSFSGVVGGIVAENAGTITDSVNIGKLEGSNVGGILGISMGTSTVKDCFYLGVFTYNHKYNPSKGTPLTMEQFGEAERFSNFDFNAVWEYSDHVERKFPTIKGMVMNDLLVTYTFPGTDVVSYPDFVKSGEKITVPFYSNHEKYYIKYWINENGDKWDFENNLVTKSMSLRGEWLYQSPLTEIQSGTRYSTAVEISKYSYKQAETVIIVQGNNFPDALSAAPLAFRLNAPILLTRTDVLSMSTYEELIRLKPKNVIILGGTAAVGQEVEDGLVQSGYNVTRITGSNRYQTAYQTALYLNEGNTTKAILASGDSFADALSVGSYAAKEGIPILLTQKNRLSSSVKNAIIDLGIKEIIIVGGSSVISETVEAELMELGISYRRLSGLNRVDTSLLIAQELFQDVESLLVSNGWAFADALAAAPLAAKMNMPIILTRPDRLSSTTTTFMSEMKLRQVVVVGGSAAVNNGVRFEMTNILYR